MSNSTIASKRPSATGAPNAGWFSQLKANVGDVAFMRNLVIINGFVPFCILLFDVFNENLGANAVNNALHITGILSLVFLYFSLLVTPLRRIFGWGKLVATRRALGLFGFMYAMIHLVIYVGFDRALDLSSTVDEILNRRFLQLGAIALLLMIPLAITSTNGMIRRIGAKRWKLLHKLAYVVVILGVAHFYLLVKSDVRQPLAFAVVLTPLLGFRVVDHYLGLRKAARKSDQQPLTPSGETSVEAVTKPKFWKGRLLVTRIFHTTHNVKTFRFQTMDDSPLPFRHKAGQYLNIQLPVDDKTVRRSYTISSSPERTDYCEISVKREDHGTGSRYLHDQVNEGDVINIAAPAGQFIFDDTQHKAVTLISGGVGITPMMSTVRSLAERSWPGEIYFVFAARNEHDLIFRWELEALVARLSNFHFFPILSGLPEGHSWTGSVGRLDKARLLEFVPRIIEHPALVCGPQQMMDAVCTMLSEIGLPEDYVMTEAFVSPPASSEETEPANEDAGDTTSVSISEAQITFASSNVVATASADTNVLEAAEAVGVDVPYECRSGICGQCKVKCSEGNVHMPSEDALTASEKSAGYILACQALPRSSELRIDA